MIIIIKQNIINSTHTRRAFCMVRVGQFQWEVSASIFYYIYASDHQEMRQDLCTFPLPTFCPSSPDPDACFTQPFTPHS